MWSAPLCCESKTCPPYFVQLMADATDDGAITPKPSRGTISSKVERDAFTLRLKSDVLNFVRQAAEEENRSVPNFVETVLLGEKRRREARSKPASGEN